MPFIENYNTLNKEPVQHIRAISDLIPECTKEFKLETTIFPLESDIFIRLKKKLTLKKTKKTIEISNWGLIIDETKLSEIENLITRHFLDLYSKAKDEALTDDERSSWENIVDSLDYESFSKEIMPPQYMECTVLQKHDSKGIYLEFHDGSREWVSKKISPRFKFLKIRDFFSCYIKRDHLDRVKSINDILLKNHYTNSSISMEQIPQVIL